MSEQEHQATVQQAVEDPELQGPEPDVPLMIRLVQHRVPLLTLWAVLHARVLEVSEILIDVNDVPL